MPEYIDKNEALNAIERSYRTEDAYERVERLPAADVVEVVRCKDCKWSRERNENERNYLVEGVLICTSGEATDCCWNPVWSNHFCSCGMRGDNDA